MEVLIEALSVGLGFSVEVSVVKIGRRGTSAWSDTATQRDSNSGKIDICQDVNIMHFERTVALYSSMIKQMFICRNETEVSSYDTSIIQSQFITHSLHFMTLS